MAECDGYCSSSFLWRQDLPSANDSRGLETCNLVCSNFTMASNLTHRGVCRDRCSANGTSSFLCQVRQLLG